MEVGACLRSCRPRTDVHQAKTHRRFPYRRLWDVPESDFPLSIAETNPRSGEYMKVRFSAVIRWSIRVLASPTGTYATVARYRFGGVSEDSPWLPRFEDSPDTGEIRRISIAAQETSNTIVQVGRRAPRASDCHPLENHQ